MICYRVTHRYQCNKKNRKYIGIFSSSQLAAQAIESLRKMDGFSITPSGFKLKKIFKLKKPKSLNKLIWSDGFNAYPSLPCTKRILNKKEEQIIQSSFEFLIKDYGFSFVKNELGNAINEHGDFFFYGPVYCYSIVHKDVCIHILKLVQRQDYSIYITKEFSLDQQYIRNGILVEEKYLDIEHWSFFAEILKKELENNGNIYNYKISLC